jgi:hypothetical protein
VRVHVGPIPSEGVREWIAFARELLANREAADAPDALRLSDEVMAGFLGFLDEWEAIARSSDAFLWETEVDPEQIEFLAHALYKIAASFAEQYAASDLTITPAGGALFYRSFVNAFLDAMSAESRSLAAYAEELRSTWPYLATG